MKSEFCEFEDAVTAAIQNGNWSGELRRHVDGCKACADLELVARYCAAAMREDDEAVLPAAGFVWWRAQIAERQQQAQRAVAAIAIVQKVALGVALVLLVALSLLLKTVPWDALLEGAGLFICTGAVLYGWVRGRI